MQKYPLRPLSLTVCSRSGAKYPTHTILIVPWFLKISQCIFLKSLGQSLLNQKSEIKKISFWHACMCLIFILALAYFFWGQNGSEKCPIFIILTFYDFKTMFPKKFCDEVSKIKNPRCSFSSIFHADPQEIFFVWHFQPFLVENWPRKWAIFIFFIIL